MTRTITRWAPAARRRKITKREAALHPLVNKSADLRATKMLFDMIKDVEQKVSVTSPVPEPRQRTRSCGLRPYGKIGFIL